MMEIWRKDKELKRYSVSNTGRIKNRETGRIMKTHVNKQGHEVLSLTVDGINHNRKVSRMVAEAFLPGDHADDDVIHEDGNKLNNNVNNLRWGTRQEAVRHAFDIGTKNSNHRKRGVRIIETGEEFDSLTECGERLGCDRTSVAACLNGKSKTCKGYHLERTDI